MEPGARKAARDAELRPLMEDFGGMGAGQLPLASPKLALHRALQYAVEFWPYVMNVLEDGHLELSNNVAEQAQRIFVVGRKNWLFSDAPRGARCISSSRCFVLGVVTFCWTSLSVWSLVSVPDGFRRRARAGCVCP